MKKSVKKPSNRLIVDEFQKLKKSQIQPNSKSSNSNDQRGPYIKFKVEEVACKFCSKFIPQQNLMYHQKVCQSRFKETENYYGMIYPRPQHHHKMKNYEQERLERDQEIEHNDDYYPISRKQQIPQGQRNVINKSKRPMSAMNKKIKIKPKSSLKIEEKQTNLKKATSSSKLKEQTKNYCPVSRQKGEKSKPSSKYEQIYLKNTMQKKQPSSIHPSIHTSKLKKKTANLAQRFQNQERSFQERSVRRPDSRSKKQYPHQTRQKIKREQQPQQDAMRRRQKEQVRLDPPQITTQKLKQIVRQKLRQNRQAQRQRKIQPVAQPVRREPVRQQPQQPRQPSRQQMRNDRQETGRQPRSNRNQSRNQNYQRPRNRQGGRNPRLVPPQTNTFLNLVSRTINNQLQMMNNQFAAMSNIFQNFSNFVNINIESHPNYYQFTTHQFHSQSDQDSMYSDSSNSFSSSYDDYYEQQEQPEGMDDEQLNSIQNKRYRVEEHGQNQCTICLVELRNGDVIKQLFCDHMFHAECIQEWLRRKSACPVCRDQL